jgi:purine nucleoside permease
MPRKITVAFVETFTHNGETYSRFRREDNGTLTDVKIAARNGVVIHSAIAAKAEAVRRLRSGNRWVHPHLVRPLGEG